MKKGKKETEKVLFVDSEEDSEGTGDDDGESEGSLGEELSDVEEMDQRSVSEGSESGDQDEEEEEGAEGPSKTKKKRSRSKNKKDKKILPNEAKELKEKEHTLESNLYQVQIEELLKEVSVSEKKIKEGQQWVESLKEFLEKSKPSKQVPVHSVERILKGVSVPLPSCVKVSKDSTDEIRWIPPSDVRLVGSWGSKAAVDNISCVDVVLDLPSEYFRQKDYLNQRYHFKRAVYLAYVAKLLKQRGDNVKFGLQNGNPCKPLLLIQTQNFNVNIFTAVGNIFKPSRLSLNINNLRFEHFFGKALPEDEPEPATPVYNSSILRDMMVLESDNAIHSLIGSSDSFRNSTKLLKVWLHQRSLDKGFGAFTGFIAAAFVAFLYKQDKIDKRMTPLEVIRIVFTNIVKNDLSSTGISLSSEVCNDWHLQFDVVFLDATGYLNFTSDVSKFTFQRVQREAAASLQALETSKLSGFNSLFLTTVPFVNNFDHTLQVSYDKIRKILEDKSEIPLMDLNGYSYPVAISTLGGLIERCVGSRVDLIDHELPQEDEWCIESTLLHDNTSQIRFGFIINREAAYKLVEKCDSEDQVKSRLFKELWGSKCQLRRFKDGTLCETVVFEAKQQVMFQMLSAVLQNHMDLKPSSSEISYIDCQLENAIERGSLMARKVKDSKPIKFIKGKRKKPSSTDLQELTEEDFDSICNSACSAFDSLSKALRGLQGLPLEVSTVQGTSSILRFTSVRPTPQQYFPRCKWLQEWATNTKVTIFSGKDSELFKVPKVVEPIKVVLHLETSGKWPDNLNAVERLKCAFLTKIGQLLSSQSGLLTQVYPKYLDVVKDGFIFRISLTYYRELTLLRQLLGADGVLKFRDTSESQTLEKETLLLPQITTTLRSLHRDHQAFGKTCRLAKRWIASQLLLASPLQYNKGQEHADGRFTEECVELLVAHSFLYFHPHLSPPNEAQVGFCRFLYFLSTQDWKATPLILNFYDKLSSSEVSGIELDFVKRRDQLPPLFIATPEDKSSSVWTRSLSVVLLARAQLLAKEAYNVLTHAVLNVSSTSTEKFSEQVKKAFRTDIHDFDVLIHIRKSMNPRGCDSIDSNSTPKFLELSKPSLQSLPITDFDPVQTYLSELRNSFGHLALFLHDTYGGTFIAVVWKPDAFYEHSFTVSSVSSRSLTTSGKLTADVEEVIESFQLLGEGLVDRVERKGECA